MLKTEWSIKSSWLHGAAKKKRHFREIINRSIYTNPKCYRILAILKVGSQTPRHVNVRGLVGIGYLTIDKVSFLFFLNTDEIMDEL